MLETLEKAKDWAEDRASVYSTNTLKKHFCVFKWNNGFIVHDTKFIEEHHKEYSSEEIVYCTDSFEFKRIMIILRFTKNK